jgi:methylmalonyl-CoA carboxyltransferase 5S subunit
VGTLQTVDITEVVLRDGQQSLMATRMAIEDMTPACEDLDNAGFWSLECWGGATYDACIRYLNEDPWERLRTFKKLMPRTPLQMLLRGQALVGYRHYDDSVVERFIEKSATNGIDIFRVFDALNDVRNLRCAIKAVKGTGRHAQGALCYATSPAHTIAGFVAMAEQLMELGSDSVCIKDSAGLLKPQPAYDLVRAIKERLGEKVRVHVHVHASTGVTLVSLARAIEAGADAVDTSISSLSLGPGHNPTEALMEMLEGTGYTTRLSKDRLVRVKGHFAALRGRYSEFLTVIGGVQTEIFDAQIPGGIIANMESQLKQQHAADRMNEVLAEVPNVQRDAGYPPMATPCSQIIGTQAVLNVMMGRYKVITGEFADLMLGYYGNSIAPRNGVVIDEAARVAKKPPIGCRPADRLKPDWDAVRRQALTVKGCNGTDEDVLTSVLFPEVAPKFFPVRHEGPRNVSRKTALPRPPQVAGPAGEDKDHPGSVRQPTHYEVKLKGQTYKVTVSPG